MSARSKSALLFAAVLLVGCHSSSAPPQSSPSFQSPDEIAAAANQAFLSQKTFDPWMLTSNDPDQSLPAYFSDGVVGNQVGPRSQVIKQFQAGRYQGGLLQELPPTTFPTGYLGTLDKATGQFDQPDTRTDQHYTQILDLQTGALTTRLQSGELDFSFVGQRRCDWPRLWQTSDILIDGDPEAQQVTHANLFYLLSSTDPGSDHSIPPMGLSSSVYGGHIFWDADVWMLPALIVQHPEYAKSVVDYRFKRLAQAKRNAKAHGFAGAEYPWESADTGKEEAPAEFARERHITADVAFAAWQWYLWTGDTAYLQHEGWPILEATAQYWVSRVTRGGDGKYHIKGVLSPDETAGLVDDDAYTNAVVRYSLQAATRAAGLLGQRADPRWATIAQAIFLPYDKVRRIPAENDTPMTDRFAAKQADTLLLLHPLGMSFDAATQKRMLDFYASHTIKTGPAMTSSIHAVVAARLGLAQASLEAFQDSYRPFERAPWDAFSEKRTTDNVYFMTGIAGCLQAVLYGFAGLHVYAAGETPVGTRLAGDAVAGLYADPHLPPGWERLVVKGIHFRGKTLDLTITPDNKPLVGVL